MLLWIKESAKRINVNSIQSLSLAPLSSCVLSKDKTQQRCTGSWHQEIELSLLGNRTASLHHYSQWWLTLHVKDVHCMGEETMRGN